MDDLYSNTGLTDLIVNQDPKLDSQQLVKLAVELANATFNPADILKAFKVTDDQFKHYIKPNEFFCRAYDAAVIEWNSANSTAKRIKVRSAAALEGSLPTLVARMVDAKESLPAVVETAKLFAKLAGVGEEKQTAASGEKFTININIGSKKIEQTVQPTIDTTPISTLEKLHD